MSGTLDILTWNCKGAYRKKQKHLFDNYDPDIWVIQECEHPDRLIKEKDFKLPDNYVWFGDNANRGLAVFSKPGFDIEIQANHNPDFRYIVPIRVSGSIDLSLFAIWAMTAEKSNRRQRYIGQVYSAFNYYQLDKDKNTLILGDFNWNLRFDKKSYGLVGKFHDFQEQMSRVDFLSAYHEYFSEDFGYESRSTLYLQGKNDKPFHIDYIWGTNSMINKLKALKVGNYNDWSDYSDHMPNCAEFAF